MLLLPSQVNSVQFKNDGFLQQALAEAAGNESTRKLQPRFRAQRLNLLLQANASDCYGTDPEEYGYERA